MSSSRLLLCLLVWLPVSCASNSDHGKSNTSDPAPEAATHKSLSQRLNDKNGYKQDAGGNWVPQKNQRSSFESKGKSAYFQGDYQKKAYQTDTYTKKSWWGNKDYGRKPYAGNTDGSQFEQSSRFSGKGARESGSAADLPKPYQTGTYATHSARETSQRGIAKPTDARTDTRRKVYPEPEIIDWKQQRALSLEQSKGILGH